MNGYEYIGQHESGQGLFGTDLKTRIVALACQVYSNRKNAIKRAKNMPEDQSAEKHTYCNKTVTIL